MSAVRKRGRPPLRSKLELLEANTGSPESSNDGALTQEEKRPRIDERRAESPSLLRVDIEREEDSGVDLGVKQHSPNRVEIVVTEVRAGSLAYELGVRAGDPVAGLDETAPLPSFENADEAANFLETLSMTLRTKRPLTLLLSKSDQPTESQEAPSCSEAANGELEFTTNVRNLEFPLGGLLGLVYDANSESYFVSLLDQRECSVSKIKLVEGDVLLRASEVSESGPPTPLLESRMLKPLLASTSNGMELLEGKSSLVLEKPVVVAEKALLVDLDERAAEVVEPRSDEASPVAEPCAKLETPALLPSAPEAVHVESVDLAAQEAPGSLHAIDLESPETTLRDEQAAWRREPVERLLDRARTRSLRLEFASYASLAPEAPRLQPTRRSARVASLQQPEPARKTHKLVQLVEGVDFEDIGVALVGESVAGVVEGSLAELAGVAAGDALVGFAFNPGLGFSDLVAKTLKRPLVLAFKHTGNRAPALPNPNGLRRSSRVRAQASESWYVLPKVNRPEWLLPTNIPQPPTNGLSRTASLSKRSSSLPSSGSTQEEPSHFDLTLSDDEEEVAMQSPAEEEVFIVSDTTGEKTQLSQSSQRPVWQPGQIVVTKYGQGSVLRVTGAVVAILLHWDPLAQSLTSSLDDEDGSRSYAPVAYLRDDPRDSKGEIRDASAETSWFEYSFPASTAPGARTIVSKHSRAECARLWPGLYLNDGLIDVFLSRMLHELLPLESRPLVHVFSSGFFHHLRSRPMETSPKDYADMASWTRNADVFSKDFWIIPVNNNLHWSLVILCYPARVLEDYQNYSALSDETRPCGCLLKLDSTKGHNSQHVGKQLRSWIQALVRQQVERAGGETPEYALDAQVLPLVAPPRLPQQSNGSDCGVFLLEFARRFLLEKAPTFVCNRKETRKHFSDVFASDWFADDVAARARVELMRVVREHRAKAGA